MQEVSGSIPLGSTIHFQCAAAGIVVAANREVIAN